MRKDGQETPQWNEDVQEFRKKLKTDKTEAQRDVADCEGAGGGDKD